MGVVRARIPVPKTAWRSSAHTGQNLVAAMATFATRALMAPRTPVFSTFLYHTPVQYR